MIKNLKRFFVLIFLVGCMLNSCTKENRNSRKIAGVWQAKKITYQLFDNDKIVLDSTASFTGTMKLQNIDGLENNAFFSDLSPNPFAPVGFTDDNWQVSYRKLTTINFYLVIPSLLIDFSVTYNIDKITNRKLILSTYGTGSQAELTKKISYEFEKY